PKSKIERLEVTSKLLQHLFHVLPACCSSFFHQTLNSFGCIRNRRQVFWHNSAFEQGSCIFGLPKENRKTTTIRFLIPETRTLFSKGFSSRSPMLRKIGFPAHSPGLSWQNHSSQQQLRL